MNVGDVGAADVARALCRNSSLKVLELPNNTIGDLGASKLAAMLCVNKVLVLLDLKGNFVGDVGCRKLMLALRKNESVGKRNVKLGKNRARVVNCFKRREIDVKLGFSDVKANRIPQHLFKLSYVKP